jgi:putative LysE/RhtB family amino acid efflux pump
MDSFREGIVIGFAVAAPVGPIGVLVIQRSLGSALVGLSTGLGAAVADGTYALVGAVATALVAHVVAAAWLLELVGGTALAWLAWRTLRQPTMSVVTRSVDSLRLARAFGETVFLTAANPATILSFAAIAASQGLAKTGHAPVFASGVFVGSASWWLLLASGVRFGSRKLTPRALRAIHLSSAAVLAAFAALALWKAFADH